MNLRQSSLTEGVSPVIGVILMVVITVVLGAIVANYMLDFGDQSDQQNPSASLSFDQSYDPNANATDLAQDGNTYNTTEDGTFGYTVEAQLTRAASIDFVTVELGSGVNETFAQVNSTDSVDHNGDGSGENDMDGVGDVITVSHLQAGDKFSVIGNLDGRDQVLNRYQVRQR